jgi:carbonic anhydrase
MQMVAKFKAAGTGNGGVVVLSCSDPRLNPDQILGLDASLSE